MRKWKDLDGSKLTKEEIIALLKCGFRITMSTGTLRNSKEPLAGACLCNEESRDNYKVNYDLANGIILDENLKYLGNKPFRGMGININQMSYGYGETTMNEMKQEFMDLLRATTFNQ